jgi:hypothetical protein
MIQLRGVSGCSRFSNSEAANRIDKQGEGKMRLEMASVRQFQIGVGPAFGHPPPLHVTAPTQKLDHPCPGRTINSLHPYFSASKFLIAVLPCSRLLELSTTHDYAPSTPSAVYHSRLRPSASWWHKRGRAPLHDEFGESGSGRWHFAWAAPH